MNRRQKKEARNLVQFIDKAFGGKLYPFRSYQVKPETTPETSAGASPESDDEPRPATRGADDGRAR